jgi:hypothetical protein
LSLKTKVDGLALKPLGRFSPVWPQNRWRRFQRFDLKTCCGGFCWFDLKTSGDSFHRFGLKTVATVSAGLASQPATTVSGGLASKPATMVFSSLASKLVPTVSPGLTSKPMVGFLVEPQNQSGGGFHGLGLKIASSGLVI